MILVRHEYEYPKCIDHFLDYSQYNIFSQLLYGEKIDMFDFNKRKSLPSLVYVLAKKINPLGNYEELTYKDILIKILNKNNISFSSSISDKEMEEIFLKYKFKTIVENLSQEQRLKLNQQIQIIAEKEGLSSEQLKSISTTSLLTIANLSGFGMYIMASTVVGGISGVLGVTLPFAFYTGMSSFLSFISGPVGWTFGLGYLAYTFKDDSIESAVERIGNQFFTIKKQFTGDYEYVESVVVFIASNRLLISKKIVEFEEESFRIGYCRDMGNRTNRQRTNDREKIKNETQAIENFNFEIKWSQYLSSFKNNYVEALCSKDDMIKIKEIEEKRKEKFLKEWGKNGKENFAQQYWHILSKNK